MNIVIIIAGGVGSKMALIFPNNSLKLMENYTCDSFQNHHLIDAIEVGLH